MTQTAIEFLRAGWLTRKRVVLCASLLVAIVVVLRWRVSQPDDVCPVIRTLGVAGERHRPEALSPDGSTLATIGFTPLGGNQRPKPNTTVALWDVASGRVRARIDQTDMLSRAVFSPDGRWLAMARFRPKLEVLVFDALLGKERTRFEITEQYMHNLRFSPDGSTLQATALTFDVPPRGGDVIAGSLLAWDAATWKALPRRPILARPSGNPAFSPDGRLIAAAPQTNARQGVVLWDPVKPEPLATLLDPNSMASDWSAWFVDGGATLAVARSDGAVVLWDLATRQRKATLPVHSSGYVSHLVLLLRGSSTLISSARRIMGPVAFSTMAKSLLSRVLRLPPPPPENDVEMIVWDLASGRRLASWKGEGAVFATPDGSAFVTAALDGMIRFRKWPRASSKRRP